MMVAIAAEYAATMVHHVYGGLAYGAPERLAIAAIFTAFFVVTLALYGLYVRRRAAWTFQALLAITALVWIANLGFFEGAYNHAYKDALYLLDVPRQTVLRIHPVVMKDDFTYPPDNVLFETSGVMQFVTSLFTLYFLVRTRRR